MSEVPHEGRGNRVEQFWHRCSFRDKFVDAAHLVGGNAQGSGQQNDFKLGIACLQVRGQRTAVHQRHIVVNHGNIDVSVDSASDALVAVCAGDRALTHWLAA